MNKKKIIIGILICIVLLITLSLLIKLIKGNPTGGNTLEGQLLFSGMGVISETYKGEFETKEITQKLQEVVTKEIPELYKNIKKIKDENRLKQYYNDEKNELKDIFGIQSEEEFITFSNKISQTKIDLDSWQKVKINRESFKAKSDKTGYAYLEFDVLFKNEEKISFSLYLANRKLTLPQFVFNIK